MAKAAIHGASGASAGAINASIYGNDIGLGALTGAISGSFAKYFGLKTGLLNNLHQPDNFFKGLVGSAFVGGVTGGIASELYGGTFETGFKAGMRIALYGFFFNAARMAIPQFNFRSADGWQNRFYKAVKMVFGRELPQALRRVDKNSPVWASATLKTGVSMTLAYSGPGMTALAYEGGMFALANPYTVSKFTVDFISSVAPGVPAVNRVGYFGGSVNSALGYIEEKLDNN